MLNSRRPLKPPPKVIPPTHHNSNNRQSKYPNESLIAVSEDNTSYFDKDSSRKESKIFPLDVDVPNKYLSSSFDFEEAVQQEMKRLELEFLSQLEPQDVKKNSNLILKSDINAGKVHSNNNDISITSPKVDRRKQHSFEPQEIDDDPHVRRNSYEMQKQYFGAPDFNNNQKKYSPISEPTLEFQDYQQPKIQEPAYVDHDASYQRNSTNNSHLNQYGTPAKNNSVISSPQGSTASIISNNRNRSNPNDLDDNKARKRRQQEEYRRELEKQMYEADLTKKRQKEKEDSIDSERFAQHQQFTTNNRLPNTKNSNSSNINISNGTTSTPPKQYPNNISPTPVSMLYSNNDGRYQQQNGSHSSLSGNKISYNNDMNDFESEGNDSFGNKISDREDGGRDSVAGRDDRFQYNNNNNNNNNNINNNNNQRPYLNDNDNMGIQRLRISSPSAARNSVYHNVNEMAANSTPSPQKSNQARQRMLNDVFGGSNSPTKTDITNEQTDSNRKWRPSKGTIDNNKRQAILEQRAALEEQVQETRRRKEEEKRRQRQEEEEEERRIQQEIQAAENLKKQTKLAKQKELQQISLEENHRHDVAIADKNARRRGGAVAAAGGYDANGYIDDNQSHYSNTEYTPNKLHPQPQSQPQPQYQRSSPMKPNVDYQVSENNVNISQPMIPTRRAVPLGALQVETGGNSGRSSNNDGRSSVAMGRAPVGNMPRIEENCQQMQGDGYMTENGYRNFSHHTNNASNNINDYQQLQQPYPQLQSQNYPPRYAIPHQQPIPMYPGYNFQDNISYSRNSNNSRLNVGNPYGPNQQPYNDDPLQELRSVSSMSNYTSQTQISSYVGMNPSGRQSSMTVDDPSLHGGQYIQDSRRILPTPLELIQNEPPNSLMSLIDENARLAAGGTGDLEAYVENWQRRNGYHSDVIEGQQHRQDRRLYENITHDAPPPSNKSQHHNQYLTSPNKNKINASNKPTSYTRSSSRYDEVHVDVGETEEDFGEVSFVSESRFVPSIPISNGNLFDNNSLSKNNHYNNDNLIRNPQKNNIGNNGNMYNRDNNANKYSSNSLTFSNSPGKIGKPLPNNRSHYNTNATAANANLEKSLTSVSCLLFHSTANPNITDSMSYFFTNNLIDCVDNKTMKDLKEKVIIEGTKEVVAPISKRYSPVNTNLNKLDSEGSPRDSTTKLSISTAPGTPLSKLLKATFTTEIVTDSLLFNVSDTYDEENIRTNLGFNNHDHKKEYGSRGSLQTSGSLQTNGVLKPSKSSSRPSTVGSGRSNSVRHSDMSEGGDALHNLVGIGVDTGTGIASKHTGRRNTANENTATSPTSDRKLHKDLDRPRSVAAILQSVDMYRDVCNFGDPLPDLNNDNDNDNGNGSEESELHILKDDLNGRPRTAAGSKKTNFTDLDDNSLGDSLLLDNEYDNESFEGSDEEILVVPTPPSIHRFHRGNDDNDEDALNDENDSFLPTSTTSSSTSSNKKSPFQIHTLTEYDHLAIQGKRGKESDPDKRKTSK